MDRKYLLQCLVASALALPAMVSAQQAYNTLLLNLRAGPGQEYPVVTVLPQGTNFMVQGCLSDFTWCDVSLPDATRGWASASYIAYPYQGSSVEVRNMGATIGIPVLTFALGAYWASHYRDRPWYHNQSQWNHHRPPPSHGWHAPPPHHGWRPPPPPPHRPPGFDHNRPRPPMHDADRPPPRPHPPSGRPPTNTRPPYERPRQDAPPPAERPQRPQARPEQSQRPDHERNHRAPGGQRLGVSREAN